MEYRRTPMKAYSTLRSVVWMSVAILCLLSVTAVLADGPGPKPPKDYPKDPETRRSPDPPPSPEVKPDPKKSPTDPIIGRPDEKPTPPPPPKETLWWWISAAILLLLLLFFLTWILRRRKTTGYNPPSTQPSGPTYPPVDQSPKQARPDQYSS